MVDHEKLLDIARNHTDERFRTLRGENVALLPPLLRPPKLRWRAWAPEGVVGVFLETAKIARAIKDHEKKGLEPFPGLLTTDPSGPVAIELSGSSLNFFASNRVEGLVGFRVKPNSSFTLWQHIQVFRPRSSQPLVYIVPLAFILSVPPSEEESDLLRRLDELIDHTLGVWGKFED